MTTRQAQALLVGLLTTGPGTAAEAWQVRPYEVDAGFRDNPAIPFPLPSERCALELEPTGVVVITEETCSLIATQVLGTTGATEWLMARYRRGAIAVYDSTFSDTLDVDEVLLIRRAPTGTSLVWRQRRDRRFEFIQDITWVDSPYGPILDIRLCLNGTGGCTYEYLRYADPDGWRPVRQQLVDGLTPALPDSSRLHKGRRIDLAAMRGTWPLAGPTDGNCCPTGMIEFDMTMVGDTLKVERVTRVSAPRSNRAR